MLKSFGFDAHITLSTLMEKALINIDPMCTLMEEMLISIDPSVVWMHDLIQSMAFEIVHQEYLTNPERCRRLVNPDDIFDVLKNNRKSDAIRGIRLDLSQIGDLQLSAGTFRKMTNLRFLEFYSSCNQRSCTVNLPSGLDSFSESLSDLQLENFPLKSQPLSLCAEKIVTLRMFDSNIKKLWDGVQNLVNLSDLYLTGSKYLMELPDISRAQNLRKLSLVRCQSLKSLKAERLPKSIELIYVTWCPGLKEFSFSSNKMKRLYLMAATSIEILDFPMGGMEKLKQLIIDCSELKNLPIDAIGCMRSLLDLRLFYYSGIIDKSNLHNLFDSLLSLETIYLIGACKLTELPHNIKHLSRLKYLDVRQCKSLLSLQELPPSIEYLDASDCTSLYSLDLATAPPLRSLLKDCLKLENHYMESACFQLKRAIYTRKACEICYPGRKVPEWFKSNQGIDVSNKISIELPSTSTDLIGFVLCSVLSHLVDGHHLQCQLYYDGKKHTCSEFEQVVGNFDSHYVFLWYLSDMFINFGKTMDDLNTNYRPNMSFEFSVVRDSVRFVDDVIEVCGVCPIYASEYPKFIQQMELEGAQKETCQDDDENSFHGTQKYANFSLQTRKCGNFKRSKIPKWFTYKSSMTSDYAGLQVTVQLAPDFDKVMGLIFCFVIPNFSSKERDQCYSTSQGQLEYEGYYDASFSGLSGWHYSMRKLNSNDVFLWYDHFLSEYILKHLKYLRRIKGCDAKLDLKFFFNLGYGLIDDETGESNDEVGEIDVDKAREIQIDNCLIKECGVRPIYVSKYTNFLQQEKLKEVKDCSIDQSIPKNSESTAHTMVPMSCYFCLPHGIFKFSKNRTHHK